MTIDRENPILLFPKIGKISIIVFSSLLVIIGLRAYILFGYIFNPNVTVTTILYIPTGSTYNSVEDQLDRLNCIKSMSAFKWVVKKKKYSDVVKPGRYELKKGMNSNTLVNMLRSGNQTPLELTFTNARTRADIAGKVSRYLESDSIDVLRVLQNDSIAAKYGFKNETFLSMFIPDTYQFFWTTTPAGFIERMRVEYVKFWDKENTEKAKKLGLSPLEISILASIIQEETTKKEDKPRIAGVYLNRIKRGMPLQADPTVKYAIGDFSIRRVSTEMLKVNSPYNTYQNLGLPPGPICVPERSTLEAVLSPEKHNYLYFCAKEDFSGYSNFSRTLDEHINYANQYHKALNRRKIFR